MLSAALEVGDNCLVAGVSVTEVLRDTHTQMKHGKERKAGLLPAAQHMRLHLLKGKFSSFSLKSKWSFN